MLKRIEDAAGMAAAAALMTLPLWVAALVIYALVSIALPSRGCAQEGEYLGRIGSNPFCSDCTANPFADISNPYSAKSLNNPYGRYGNPFSAHSPNNPYARRTPRVYGD